MDINFKNTNEQKGCSIYIKKKEKKCFLIFLFFFSHLIFSLEEEQEGTDRKNVITCMLSLCGLYDE